MTLAYEGHQVFIWLRHKLTGEALPALNSWAGAAFALTNQGSEDASLPLSSGFKSIGLY